jgi:hypothetical protein
MARIVEFSYAEASPATESAFEVFTGFAMARRLCEIRDIASVHSF